MVLLNGWLVGLGKYATSTNTKTLNALTHQAGGQPLVNVRSLGTLVFAVCPTLLALDGFFSR